MVRLFDKVVFLFLSSSGFGRCDQQQDPPVPEGFFDAGPDFIQPCPVQDKCDDSECIEKFGERSQATGVGFHQYMLDQWGDSDEMFGAQYYICACNMEEVRYWQGIVRFVKADFICKINEYRLPLPEDSYEPCSGDKDDCHRYCNEVTFEAWEEANRMPEGGGGMGAVASSTDSGNCECSWGKESVVGCTLPEPSLPPSPDESSGATPAIVTTGLHLALAVFVATVGIEVRNFL